MSKFSKLMAKRKSSTAVADAFKSEKKSFSKIETYYPERNKQGVASVTIRFLPANEGESENGESSPFVKIFSHGFQGPNGWYFSECNTTSGGDCPVCEMNSDYIKSHDGGDWKTASDATKKLIRDRKRKQKYFANIIVIEDKNNPENEGKVFLFQFGFKIYKMIEGMMFPEFDDDEPVDVFDMVDGADFNLKITKVNDQTNYDKSSFKKPSALFDGDESKMESAWNDCKPLQTLVENPSYEDNKTKLDKVMGTTQKSVNTEVKAEKKMKEKPAETIDDIIDEPQKETKSGDDESDIMDYFDDLAS